MKKPITIERVMELVHQSTFGLENPGICLACGEEQEGCEPDACRRKCDHCGEFRVYGAEELLIMGVA